MHVCIYIYIYTHIHKCVCVCVNSMCVYVYLSLSIYIYIYIHANIYVYIHLYIHIYICIMARTLEPAALSTAVLALSKLRASDPEVVISLEQAAWANFQSLHVQSLPMLLDSFVELYVAGCTAEGGLDSEGLSPERRSFISRLSSRLSRELVQLRPQDASRALQALDRLGALDPQLLANCAQFVPER